MQPISLQSSSVPIVSHMPMDYVIISHIWHYHCWPTVHFNHKAISILLADSLETRMFTRLLDRVNVYHNLLSMINRILVVSLHKHRCYSTIWHQTVFRLVRSTILNRIRILYKYLVFVIRTLSNCIGNTNWSTRCRRWNISHICTIDSSICYWIDIILFIWNQLVYLYICR